MERIFQQEICRNYQIFLSPMWRISLKDICSLVDQMKDMDILFSTVAMENDTDLVQTQLGKFPKGCVWSYQQKMSSDYILKLIIKPYSRVYK